MKFDLSQVEFSETDIEREIKIPNKLTPELAEIIGLHLGDGNIYKQAGRGSVFSYTCCLDQERAYYDQYFIPKLKGLFNLKVRPHIPKENEYRIRIYSKALFTFFTKVLKIPACNKNSMLAVPQYIKESSREVNNAFVRGFADTDFCLIFKKRHKKFHYYPSITGMLSSATILQYIEDYLQAMGFELSHCYNRRQYDRRTGKFYTKNEIALYGSDNLGKWMREIGFSNPKNITRYAIWKQYGICPPQITQEERNRILSGERSPYSHYE
ncbi:MAG: hypothetical protein ABH829_04340 [archaeon]